MATRWEYKKVEFSNLPDLDDENAKELLGEEWMDPEWNPPYDGSERARRILDTLGEEGWELVSRHEDDFNVKYIFKRPRR